MDFATADLSFMEEHTVNEELVMFSSDKTFEKVQIDVPADVTFKYADTSDEAEMKKLQKAVAAVEEDWVQYFKGKNIPYLLAYKGTEIASFCIVDDFGTEEIDGKTVKIGGPGCVGTVPEFRKNGIGLKMVQKATKDLFDNGYGISWIHWTGVGPWYMKLGYKSVLKWNKKGFII